MGSNGTSKRARVTINCDMGEAFGSWKMGPDEELMPLIDLANVACGFHGGDPVVMRKTVQLAKKHGVPVGAHPSLPDREGFGRRHIDLSPDDLFAQLVYQIGALEWMLRSENMKLNHIKTHGYLWRYCESSEAHCRAVMQAIQVFGVPMLVIAETRMEKMAAEMGIPYIPEFYPDIYYNEEGKLMSILRDGRVKLEDVQPKVERIIAHDEVIAKTTGKPVKMNFSGREFSCCIHSDLPHPVETLEATRKAIEAVV